MNIGRKIYGYCGGVFGRDSYGEKIIIGEGYDWIVIDDSGVKRLADFKGPEEKQRFIDDNQYPETTQDTAL